MLVPGSDDTAILTALGDWEEGDDPIEIACDYRDIPVTASISAWNREEFQGEDPDENLVVSPAPPGSRPTVKFEKEVNVITFRRQQRAGCD